MAKFKIEFLSNLGTLFEMFKGIAEEVRALVGNDRADEALMKVHTDKALRRKIAELIAEAVKSVRETFTFTVNHSKSLAEMIAAGCYDWTDSNINATNFPIKGEGSVETEGELFHFNRDIGSDEAIRLMDKDGYRSGTIEELLALGASQPELQRQFPIVALGSVWQRDGRRNVPFLDGSDAKRDLDLHWIDGVWSVRCRFLAVRKSSSR